MTPDHDVELGIQALLDGRPLPDGIVDPEVESAEPLRVIDAIARAHRVAILGKEFTPERSESSRW
jgi:hypothetical protein